MKKLSAFMAALLLTVSVAQTRPAVAGSSAEGVLAIIFGATVATLMIDAFDRTTNGPRSEIGFADIREDAQDYLATGKVGPALDKVYSEFVTSADVDMSVDEFTGVILNYGDEIEAAIAQ